MKLKISNLNKPTNRKWKLIGDIILYAVIPELTLIATIDSLTPIQKFWVAFGVAQASLISKLITKFTAEADTNVE